jgi:nucleotide-binding universal stress UspA family protein
MKINKVLIALNYNATAKKIAKAGYLVAKAMDAEILFLHVLSNPMFYYSSTYDPIMGFSSFPAFDPELPDVSEKLIAASKNFLEEIKEYFGDPSINILVKEGDYSEMIIETANVLNADLIVLGSHSEQWLEKILLTSTTERILEISTIPLLIIPTKNK